MPKTHCLKTHSKPFQAVLDGSKKYEVRVNDRDFKEGDYLILQEVDEALKYTDREERYRVTYMTRGGEYGLPKNMCVMSITRVSYD